MQTAGEERRQEEEEEEERVWCGSRWVESGILRYGTGNTGVAGERRHQHPHRARRGRERCRRLHETCAVSEGEAKAHGPRGREAARTCVLIHASTQVDR